MKRLTIDSKHPNGIIEEVEDTPIDNQQQIQGLKSQLADSDYKELKCLEYAQQGLPMPYDIDALHKERQAIRDKINELELGVDKTDNM